MTVTYLCICKFKKHYNSRYMQEYQISKIYSRCWGIASLFQKQASRFFWTQYNILQRRLDKFLDTVGFNLQF